VNLWYRPDCQHVHLAFTFPLATVAKLEIGVPVSRDICLIRLRFMKVGFVVAEGGVPYSRVSSTRRLRARPPSVSLVSMRLDAP
jgi:hypothetical protein